MYIVVSKRRPDGTEAKFTIRGIVEQFTTTKEETAEMLLDMEMGANASLAIRVHVHDGKGFHTLG